MKLFWKQNQGTVVISQHNRVNPYKCPFKGCDGKLELAQSPGSASVVVCNKCCWEWLSTSPARVSNLKPTDGELRKWAERNSKA